MSFFFSFQDSFALRLHSVVRKMLDWHWNQPFPQWQAIVMTIWETYMETVKKGVKHSLCCPHRWWMEELLDGGVQYVTMAALVSKERTLSVKWGSYLDKYGRMSAILLPPPLLLLREPVIMSWNTCWSRKWFLLGSFTLTVLNIFNI